MKRPDRRQFLHLAASATALPAVSRVAQAQTYPDRPVRVVVPYAPGGPTDVVTRLVAQKLSDRSGKQFYVENIGGGGGNVAMGRVAKMAPDGYTLLMVNPSYVVNPTLYRELPYGFERDFDLVSLAVLTTLVITVHPSVPAQSLKDLITLIKANPRKYSYASPGTGTPGHLVGEVFRHSLGLDLVPCALQQCWIGSERRARRPYADLFRLAVAGGPASDRRQTPWPAVTSKARSQALPDLPTTAEAGYPEVAGDNWQGIVVPSGTPKAIISVLHREIAEIMRLPDVKERLAVLGFEPVASSPAEFTQHARAEFEKWAKVIRDSNIKAE